MAKPSKIPDPVKKPNQNNLLRPALIDTTTSTVSPITPDDAPIAEIKESETSFAHGMPIHTRKSKDNINNDQHDNNHNDGDEVELRSRLTNIHLCHHDYKSYSSDHNQTFDDIKEVKQDHIENDPMANIFRQKGYKYLNKMRDTLQGSLYKAQRVKDGLMCAIKVTSKELHNSRTSEQDGMSIIVEENIILESIILHHLTVANTPISSDYIVGFIDFFEDDSNYYLVMEYVEGMTLRDFTNKCHKMMQMKQLNLREYKKICKFIFWQISANISWLHNDMNLAHLDLNMDNIMIENGTFIKNEDDSISINPDLNVKLIDFGLSEIFNTKTDINDDNNNPFSCSKHGMTNNQTYVAPKVFDGDVYDAKCADMWSLGIILFTMCVGREPYQYPNDKTDAGYWSLKNENIGDFQSYLKMSHLTQFLNDSLISLILGLLDFNDSNRFNIKQVLESDYLLAYWRRYQTKITEKSQLQKMANYLQRDKMKDFPYYKMNRH